MDKVSPLSFLISIVHQQLSESARNLVVTYLCGIHAISPFDEETSAPLMMARSIISQLLARAEIDWNRGPDGWPILSFIEPETMARLQDDSFTA